MFKYRRINFQSGRKLLHIVGKRSNGFEHREFDRIFINYLNISILKYFAPHGTIFIIKVNVKQKTNPMKKKLNLIMAACFIFLTHTQSTIAQENDQLLNFGIKGGLNYSWLNLDDVDDENGKMGYHLGVMTRVNIVENLGVQGELLYTTKGSKIKYDNAFFDGEATLRLNYIEIPVLLVFKINENINIHAGPYVSFIVDANAKNESSVDLFDYEDEVDKDNFKGTDYGFAAGIGAAVNHIFGGIRYTQGLEDIEKEKDFNGTSYKFSAAKNSMVQLYAGFIF